MCSWWVIKAAHTLLLMLTGAAVALWHWEGWFTLMGARKRSRMLTANTRVSGYSRSLLCSSVNQRTASSRWAGDTSASCTDNTESTSSSSGGWERFYRRLERFTQSNEAEEGLWINYLIKSSLTICFSGLVSTASVNELSRSRCKYLPFHLEQNLFTTSSTSGSIYRKAASARLRFKEGCEFSLCALTAKLFQVLNHVVLDL